MKPVRPFLLTLSAFSETPREHGSHSEPTAAAATDSYVKRSPYLGPDTAGHQKQDTNVPHTHHGSPYTSINSSARQKSQAVKIAHLYGDLPEDRMTRLPPSKTGLSMHINISVAQPHESPCIKVSKTTEQILPDLEDMFTVTIPADPHYGPAFDDCGEITQSDMAKVCRFILINRETLLVFWYQLEGCESYMELLETVS